MSRSTVDITGCSKEMNLMRSTVVKKDTASCDISGGSRSSVINLETIMSHSTVDLNGYNKEMKLMRSTVVKKDTASQDDCRNSRRSVIKKETILKRSTVVKVRTSAAKNEIMGKREFQHVYKSKNTPTSRKEREAYSALVENREPKNKWQQYERIKKKKD